MHTLAVSDYSSITRRHTLKAAVLLGAGIMYGFFASASPASHPDTTGWKILIARDLSNVDMPAGSWEMNDGVLVAKTHDTLWTKESYDNFILDLEFKVEKESNSGVFLRVGNTKDVLSALEVQVHESEDGALYGMVGAIYNAQPPAKKMQKPVGEWNRFTVTCNGNKVSLVFNSEEVWDIDLNNWEEPHQNPDGTKNKFATALKDVSRKGAIGLQGLHGTAQSPVWYRNVRIKEIK